MFRIVHNISKVQLRTLINAATKINNIPNAAEDTVSCKILVIGGGTGGCAVAAKFSRWLDKPQQLIIAEPSIDHYYQPLFTLVGGGICELSQARKATKDVLPSNVKWIREEVVHLEPQSNRAITKKGKVIKYDILVLALGLETNYNKIPGLVEALDAFDGVCSNYSPKYVHLTWKSLQQFRNGNAIFTFPNSPVKCPGAPQKICYIAEEYFCKSGKRSNANVIYNTSLPVLFGVQIYADALWNVCKRRNVQVNTRLNLIEVKHKEKIAIFQNLDHPEKLTSFTYSMLHVTPPMSTPDVLRSCAELVNKDGFVDVDKKTLQSTRFNNVFAIGDCASSPNSKTAAAVAAQCPVVFNNMKSFLSGKSLNCSYDGYASCPLVTGYSKCILAEFDYDLKPLETFPFRQDRELYSMYLLKKLFMPQLYWKVMLRGYWNGPKLLREILHGRIS